MARQTGNNIKDLKLLNRALMIRLVSVSGSLSRVELARQTGLSKMAVSNLVSELITQDILEEHDPAQEAEPGYGRPPIMLRISRACPCICGMLIKRGLCQIILSDLGGKILEETSEKYTGQISASELIGMLTQGFFSLKQRADRPILAVGISSIGPIDMNAGMILNPPAFFHIENLEITRVIEEATGLKTFLINDANAGALAEKLYGQGRGLTNFAYLHIMNGIGAGFVLENKLYNGDIGQSGEIGHTSINFSGPKCTCGNTGCLELYAGVDQMRQRIAELAPFYRSSALGAMKSPPWTAIVDAANRQDYLAIAVLDEFCNYISYALIDVLNILDISNVLVGYYADTEGRIIEEILQRKISASVIYSRYRDIKISRSTFGGDAPLLGSIAIVADKIFNLELAL